MNPTTMKGMIMLAAEWLDTNSQTVTAMTNTMLLVKIDSSLYHVVRNGKTIGKVFFNN